LAQSLQPFAEALTAGIDARELAIQRIWMRRLTVIATFLVLIAGAIWGSRVLLARAERLSDLAVGKAWVTSSTYPAGCTSPEQSCGGGLGFFVHTNEEPNPWLMFDLEQPTSISALRIFNRTDCCQDRGLPLVVEVSSDQKAWKEVARRTTEFREWKAEFATIDARYVRLRAEGTAILHFSQVRILP
jgi:hypothetical protein